MPAPVGGLLSDKYLYQPLRCIVVTLRWYCNYCYPI